MPDLGSEAVREFLDQVSAKLATGQAAEHAYRPALQALVERLDEIDAVNDPKRSEFGAPDFVFQRKGTSLILGWAEAKDLGADLEKTERSEQLQRYSGYANLFLTNCLEFRFYSSGAKYSEVKVADLSDGVVVYRPENFAMLAGELIGFFAKPPQPITSGARLAEVMGGVGRRIRSAVEFYLSRTSDLNEELERIFELIRTLLVHDIDRSKFADMYAQTLVYGLFAARYNDGTSEDFSRAEARELVPQSNPFLRQFFDHIAGANFDFRLSRIVDELCEIFAVSDVRSIVNRHLSTPQLDGMGSDDRDPIIHFYEDFLRSYDPEQRKKMGAYYTPLPVVRFMVRTVDTILQNDFGMPKGLADSSKVTTTVVRQGSRVEESFHRVQVLDPAVGTATFLNEIIHFVRASLTGQEGRWPAYARDELVPRLNGFELMMAPYTVAHLKLGLTLRESGVTDLGKRLGVYLTNTLEDSVSQPDTLFPNLGLAGAVADEALEAGHIKNERPIMVVIGNPPYSKESSNSTVFSSRLVEPYKLEPGGTHKLAERNSKWLNDDYVKFMAFGEEMVRKNSSGVLAMITNHGFLTNPTFRGMRWRLMQTFDDLYILDLHGNTKRGEVHPDGGRDENVFDIQQGVAITIGVLREQSESGQCHIRHADLWGRRTEKFRSLQGEIPWTEIEPVGPQFVFGPVDREGAEQYGKGVALIDLFPVNSVGVVTAADSVLVGFDEEDLMSRVEIATQEENSDKKVHKRLAGQEIDRSRAIPYDYRPFDRRKVYYVPDVLERPRESVMRNFIGGGNISLAWIRPMSAKYEFDVLVTDSVADQCYAGNKSSGAGISYVGPLFIRDDDGNETANLDAECVDLLTRCVEREVSPFDLIDYCFGALNDPSYREKFGAFLNSDTPRVPVAESEEQFDKTVEFGRSLRKLHLSIADSSGDPTGTFPIVGDNTIHDVKYVDGRVMINGSQYFGGVPLEAWTAKVGGYVPAQKWLKDRRGRTLSSPDIEHYLRMLDVLVRIEVIRAEFAKLAG